MEITQMPRLPDRSLVWQETLNWHPTPDQQQQFQAVYQEILAGNKRLNLTRITQPDEFWEKHLWDSLRPIIAELKGEASDLNVMDIGTGAGFPGLPVAIALPHSSVTLLDSTRKKITFLAELISNLDLKNVKLLTGRAEQINHDSEYHAIYDLALVRAVAAAPICAKYALPFLKSGGVAVLYRGQWTPEEETQLKSVMNQLNGQIESIEEFTTPLTQSVRHCVYLKKCK